MKNELEFIGADNGRLTQNARCWSINRSITTLHPHSLIKISNLTCEALMFGVVLSVALRLRAFVVSPFNPLCTIRYLQGFSSGRGGTRSVTGDLTAL